MLREQFDATISSEAEAPEEWIITGGKGEQHMEAHPNPTAVRATARLGSKEKFLALLKSCASSRIRIRCATEVGWPYIGGLKPAISVSKAWMYCRNYNMMQSSEIWLSRPFLLVKP